MESLEPQPLPESLEGLVHELKGCSAPQVIIMTTILVYPQAWVRLITLPIGRKAVLWIGKDRLYR